MKVDKIKEITIDESGRLRIFPEIEKFTLIWQSATEVHWDDQSSFLFSPKPREWSYYDWYQHILNTIRIQYNCKLMPTEKTKWINIPTTLREAILVQ